MLFPSDYFCLSPLPVDTSVSDLQAEIEQHLKDERRGERLRSGVHVVIAGATNAGKSSLLNTLCKSQELDCTDTNTLRKGLGSKEESNIYKFGPPC